MAIARMKPWIDSFPDDVAAVQKVVAMGDKVPREARIFAASALNYLVTRLDLIPDWEETCGILDDAMILRLAMAMASDKDLGDLDSETLRTAGRLANECDVVQEFLGDELFRRLKHYVQGLTQQEVRGRKPATILDDDKARRDLWNEINDEMKRFPPAPMKDPEAIARTIKNYLTAKLK